MPRAYIETILSSKPGMNRPGFAGGSNS
jgi:hypothetical protein